MTGSKVPKTVFDCCTYTHVVVNWCCDRNKLKFCSYIKARSLLMVWTQESYNNIWFKPKINMFIIKFRLFLYKLNFIWPKQGHRMHIRYQTYKIIEYMRNFKFSKYLIHNLLRTTSTPPINGKLIEQLGINASSSSIEPKV